MNNKVFIAAHVRNHAVLDTMREHVEGYHFFNRYGDPSLAGKYGKFGFVSVTPDEKKDGKVKCFMRLLKCSYVYLPCGWHEDKCACRAFMFAELLGKKVIFEEDSRCR